MLGLNPVGPMAITKIGSFDFPVGEKMVAKLCKGNVDPKGGHPHVEQWYGKMGSPPLEQGWPCIMELRPEVEDPKIAPWIDMILDMDRKAVLFNTGRLSGDMVLELADDTHESVVTAHAVPYKTGGAARPLYSKTQPLLPEAEASDVWFWRDTNQLLYTLRCEFKPGEKGLTEGEVYKLLVEWEFYHNVPGTGRRHLEPFAGFDDSITFKVGPKTTP
jgi:hypothetical protein